MFQTFVSGSQPFVKIKEIRREVDNRVVVVGMVMVVLVVMVVVVVMVMVGDVEEAN